MRKIPKDFISRTKDAVGTGGFWKPQTPGDFIAGWVTGYETAETRFSRGKVKGKKQPPADVIVLEADGETVKLIASAVIRSEMDRQGVWRKTGFLLGIKFLGRVKNYNSFAVLVENAKAARA